MAFAQPQVVTMTPQNTLAEKAILSAIAENTDFLFVNEINISHFYDATNRAIFQCINDIATGESGSHITVSDIVYASSKLQLAIGDEGSVEDIINKRHGKEFIEKALGYVKDASIQRKAIKASEILGKNVHGKTAEQIAELFSEIETRVFRDKSLSVAKSAASMAVEIFAEYDDFQNGVNSRKLFFGIPPIDNMLHGVKPCYFVIGAKPSCGKTAIVLNAAYNMWREGKKGLVFSLEMAGRDLITRLAAREAHVDTKYTYGGAMNKSDLAKVKKEILNIVEVIDENGVIYDDSTMSISDIRAKSMAFHRKYGRLDFIVVDYMQLVDVDGVGVTHEAVKVQEVSKKLKALGKDLDCLVLSLSQVTPDLSPDVELTNLHLRGSKQIGQDADIILLMSRLESRNDRPDGCDLIKGNFSKGRNTGEFVVNMKFDTRYMKFDSDSNFVQPTKAVTEEEWENGNV